MNTKLGLVEYQGVTLAGVEKVTDLGATPDRGPGQAEGHASIFKEERQQYGTFSSGPFGVRPKSRSFASKILERE